MGIIDNVWILDINNVYVVGFGKVNRVIGIFDGFELREFLIFLRFGNLMLDNGIRNDFVEFL